MFETVSITERKMYQLYDLYKNDISQNVNYKSEYFNPQECDDDFMIDGLDNKKSYVYHAFSKLNMKTQVELKLNSESTTHIIFYHKNDMELIEKCIHRIYCLINCFGNYENMKMYDGMTINILLYNAPRIITNTYKRDTSEINEIGKKSFFNCTCGYATSFNKKFNICVSRRNGCLGLLTHELGHICELDLGIIKDGKYEHPYNRMKGWINLVKKYFDVNKSCQIGNLNEGINNGNSTIIHSMFLALESNVDKKYLIEKYNEYYIEEYNHSFMMLKKLLYWFKYDSIGELISKNESKYTQRSQMLEYIYCRCIYLLYFSDLMVFKVDKNVNHVDDESYVKMFYDKILTSVEIINEIMKKIHLSNNKIMTMEYYKN